MHFRSYICIFIFILQCIPFSLQAQKKDCDCREAEKLKQIFSKHYKKNQVDSALAISNTLKKDQNNCCKALGYTLEANIFLNKQHKFQDVLFNVRKSDSLLNNSKDNFLRIENDRLLGGLYYDLGKLDTAAIFYIRGLNVAKETKDLLFVSKLANDLGNVFNALGQSKKALVYQKQAVNAATGLKDNSLMAMAYSNITATYGMLRELTKDMIYIDTAEFFNKLTKKHALLAGDKYYILSAFSAATRISLERKKYNEAISYSDSILKMADSDVFIRSRLGAYFDKASAYDALKNNKAAITNYDSALTLARRMQSLGIEKLVLEALYMQYKKEGIDGKALLYLERFKAVNDSFANIEKSATINELEQKYNKVQNERTITELNQEKEILNQKEEINKLKINALIIGVLFLALFIFAIVFFYRQSVLKSKFKTLEIEQRLNRARINPHFFFNALASLQALSMEEKKSKEISEYIHRFSKIMRESLESTFNELNTIENEIEFLTHYLELQKLRSDNRFTYTFKVDDNIETDSLMIPGMILQPFIENSIEHGFSSIETGGKIDICFSLENEQLKVSVIDNGSGFKDSDKHKSYPSRATQIIRDRLYLLNKQYKTNAIFELTNLSDNKGTKVEIQLPIIPKA